MTGTSAPSPSGTAPGSVTPGRKGYAFVEIEILDWPGYKAHYVPRAVAAVGRFDGRFLHAGKEVVVKTGDLTGRRVVLIEFPSFEQALAFYDSPDYQQAIAHRDAHATVHRYYLMPADSPG